MQGSCSLCQQPVCSRQAPYGPLYCSHLDGSCSGGRPGVVSRLDPHSIAVTDHAVRPYEGCQRRMSG